LKKYYEIEKGRSVFSSDHKLLKLIKELLLLNYKIYEIDQKPGDITPYHSHKHKEIVMVYEGKMRMIIEEDIVDLEEGDIVTIEPWAIHLCCYPFEQGARFYLCFPDKGAGKPGQERF